MLFLQKKSLRAQAPGMHTAISHSVMIMGARKRVIKIKISFNKNNQQHKISTESKSLKRQLKKYGDKVEMLGEGMSEREKPQKVKSWNNILCARHTQQSQPANRGKGRLTNRQTFCNKKKSLACGALKKFFRSPNAALHFGDRYFYIYLSWWDAMLIRWAFYLNRNWANE